MPVVSASSSVKDGVVTVTMSNASMTEEVTVDVDTCSEKEYEVIEATIVTASDIRAFNDFREEEKITEKRFEGFAMEDGGLKITLPPHSVVMMRMK